MQERPIRVYGGHNLKETNFDNTRDAALYLSKRLSSPWHIGSTLVGKALSDEQLGGLGWLVAHVESSHDNPHMDRGLVWVDRLEGEQPYMHFGLSAEHGLSEKELEEFIDTILSRGDEFVAGVLDGQPNPPYSEPYPESATV